MHDRASVGEGRSGAARPPRPRRVVLCTDRHRSGLGRPARLQGQRRGGPRLDCIAGPDRFRSQPLNGLREVGSPRTMGAKPPRLRPTSAMTLITYRGRASRLLVRSASTSHRTSTSWRRPPAQALRLLPRALHPRLAHRPTARRAAAVLTGPRGALRTRGADPAARVRPIAHWPDNELAEHFGVPPEQVAYRRNDLAPRAPAAGLRMPTPNRASFITPTRAVGRGPAVDTHAMEATGDLSLESWRLRGDYCGRV